MHGKRCEHDRKKEQVYKNKNKKITRKEREENL